MQNLYFQIGYLLFLWYIIWALFNSYLKPIITRHYGRGHIYKFLFFLAAFGVITLSFEELAGPKLKELILSFFIALAIGFVLIYFNSFQKEISKGKYFLLSLPSNVLFQQTTILASIVLLTKIFTYQYSNLYFGLYFTFAHLPVLTFKWVKFRYFYLLLTFVGGTVFSYIILNLRFGIAMTYLIHYFFYISMLFVLKDEEKI
ncbi:hypothetical protein A2115_01020 [Candidatus Woesebacteria bacterium GWA1_41_8]|uniref:Uncharacterized protein n=1 Tax=Candidatus Woesebacteria bacterium GWA1_41_8 TaxID=1802471 RepID=A0A1F7WIT0_9BACT|nr:MAG: hypothetical protein A2115_01020 [Candidatus Woesebacteria bacterium GWA1_41_8]